MAFNAPQEMQNRKLLEQLKEKKKRLEGGVVPAPSTSSMASSSNSALPVNATAVGPLSGAPQVNPISTLTPDAAGMTSQQRTALQYAHANSFGYFITQDSSFGNLILPVLPRYAEK